MLATCIGHRFGMYFGFRWIRFVRDWPAVKRSMLIRSLAIGVLVLIMFAVTLTEAGIWAAVYTSLGSLEDFEVALYFSIVSYTTLRFGDVVLDEHWRLLSSFEAANGVIMFGWTTAIIIAGIKEVSRSLAKLRGAYED